MFIEKSRLAAREIIVRNVPLNFIGEKNLCMFKTKVSSNEQSSTK